MNKKLSINIYLFSAILSLVLSTILNFAFYKNLLKTYPLDGNIVFLSSVALLLFLLFFIFINLIRVRRFNYHFLFFFFPVILIIAYTMNTYGTIYDDAMIINILQTNSEETLELLSLTFFMY
ncbi:MAG: phosphoethanolamine transferase domain-containing protein, partial [Bacteriovoracaceae bacterium]|nr:phosphoethanolamine transferase domain-containing protein [Bacteriovoracaceae bacterium]